jgi:type I restriction enzyme S subunit
MAPKGWTSTTLGAAFKSRREKGKTGLPMMSVTLNDGLVDRSSLERKTDSNLTSEDHLLVMPGDIAYNMMRMWQGASGLAELEGIVSPAYVVLQPRKIIFPKFAAYLCKYPRMIHRFWAYSHGLTNDRLRLYFKDFASIHVDLPSLGEQRRIAEIMSTWDRAIEISQKLLQSHELQKKHLLNRLLTPNAKGNQRGSDWVELQLGELGTFYNGVTYSPTDVVPGPDGLIVLRSSNVQGGEIAFYDNVYLRSDIDVGTLTQAGDILICVRNGSRALIGKSAAITSSSKNLAHGAFMSLFRPTESPDFCRHLFATERFSKLVSQNLGATINSINTSDMKSYLFTLPPRTRWKRIGQILSLQDRALALLRSQHINLVKQRGALLQQLIAGKKRVKFDEEKAA